MLMLLPGRGVAVEPTPTLLRAGALSVILDPHTGGLAEIRLDGQRLAEQSKGVPPFDVRQEERWIVGQGGVPLKLLDVKTIDEHTVVATARAGDWQIAVRYELDAQWPMLTRSAVLTWQGTKPTKLKGFWLGSPTFTVGKQAYYYSPGGYPPRRFPADAFRRGATHAFHHSLSPLVAQLTPQRSVLWLCDELTPDSDRSSVTVTESEGAFRVSQGFQALARMEPGVSQHIGSACLWLVDVDGESALLRIHDWMRRRGHVPPADRPAWFQDAILYSFHPGGTIGSGFRDLGGFAAATRLLDRIAALGANAIWVMPIEDASVYHPRDYYKFQPGLGTPEEYRQLVARAHQLGLHVLQDCVPHGGRNDYPRAKQHPEWLAYDEDGSTLSYWCYDFNWPTWRQYMAGVARHYVTRFDVDGYRVDAVGGSRIPNWSPKIPYARASHAQLQGGLNMLRALRGAVKESKPQVGGLLAEVQGSVYGTTSDAVYDFTGCYQAFQDLRRLPAEQYVPQLRRWLHEQQSAETPDLLRLRHIESHDSLRAELWYGIRPMRAMMALSAWIHGMPLVYHEMENGHEQAFRRIFAIRRQLAELSRGTADYLAVQTPPAVFACLRTYEKQSSVVLVNLAAEAVDTSAAVPRGLLPKELRSAPAITVLRPHGEQTVSGTIVQDQLRIPVHLEPFEYVVCVLRTASAPFTVAVNGEPAASAPRAAANTLRPVIDPRTGLLDGVQSEGQNLLGKMDLYVPAAWRQAFQHAVGERSGPETVWRYPLGNSSLELRYTTETDGLHIHSRWRGEMPSGAAIYLPVTDAARWSVVAAAGRLCGEYVPRHRSTESAHGSIYWRAQGTNAIWDSLVHPLGTPAPQLLTAEGRKTFGIGFPGPLPARVEWLDRLGSQEQLGALVAWADPLAPGGARCPELEILIGDGTLRVTPGCPAGLRPDAGGWSYENEHYRLRLGRSGMITQLWAKQPALRLLVDRGDMYTDGGFSSERERFAASNEVEAASRIDRDGQGNLRLRFEGRLRGFQRFDLLNPPVEYFAEYTLGQSASLRASYGVRTHADPSGKFAFLALINPLPDMRRAVFKHGGQLLHDGPTSNDRARGWQSRSQPSAALADEIELRADDAPLVRLTGLACGGRPLENAFAHGQNFFLAWFDGPPHPVSQRQWQWTSAVWTVGGAAAEAIGQTPVIPRAAEKATLPLDPGFEQTIASRLVSLRTGEPLPGDVAESPWHASSGGRIVLAPVHSGQAAAEVATPSGAYALWRQPLPTATLREGARLRLSAWVKGEAIRNGDAGWKVGVVRFAVITDKTQYVSSVPLLGTFDWRKVDVQWTVPPGVRSVSVEAGLNGSTGTMWIDDVQIVVE
jgi:glycosidase